MKVLVTGATGFVGSNLVPELIQAGHEVCALGYTQRPLFDGVHYYQGDLADPEFWKEISFQPEIVIHLAGLMLTAPAQRQSLFRLALQGTANLIHFCSDKAVKKFIFTSSTVSLGASVDGAAMVNESFECQIKDWHRFANVAAKREAEKLIVASEMNWTILYSSLLYGAGDWKKSIRKVNKAILKGRMPFYFSGGVNINQIENFVDGIMLTVQKAGPRSRYVMGGDNISNKEFFEMLAKSCDSRAPAVHLPDWILRAMAGVQTTFSDNGPLNPESVEMLLAYHWCDSGKAERELGYQKGSAAKAIENSTKWIVENDEL